LTDPVVAEPRIPLGQGTRHPFSEGLLAREGGRQQARPTRARPGCAALEPMGRLTRARRWAWPVDRIKVVES